MDIMWYFARICARVRSWREFTKCRFAHFPSFFSIHVDIDKYLVKAGYTSNAGRLLSMSRLSIS